MPQITLENGTKVDISQESYNKLSITAKKFPQEGLAYFFNIENGNTFGKIWENEAIDIPRKKQNNIYRTKEDAEMGAKRDRLMRTPNTAEKEDSSFYTWNFYAKNSITIDGCYWGAWITQPKFATEQEAKDWGESAQPVFEHFNQ